MNRFLNREVAESSVLKRFTSNVVVADNEFLHGPDSLELRQYRMRVHVLHRVLIKDCEKGITRDRREVLSADTELEMEKLLYRRMLTTLSECRTRKRATTSRPATTAVTTTPTSTVKATAKSTQKTVTAVNMTPKSTMSTPKATITDNMTPKSIKSKPKATTTDNMTSKSTKSTPMTTSIPSECISAINLTESWRRDYKGSDIRPVNGGYNCDTKQMIQQGRPWFRFSGAAGNRLLDSCRSLPGHSCGAVLGMWSNDAMPIATGESRVIDAYAAYSATCYAWTQKLNVMKCSERQYDYIYKYLGDDHCHLGFCGMV